jgi:hypothetical protein
MFSASSHQLMLSRCRATVGSTTTEQTANFEHSRLERGCRTGWPLANPCGTGIMRSDVSPRTTRSSYGLRTEDMRRAIVRAANPASPSAKRTTADRDVDSADW